MLKKLMVAFGASAVAGLGLVSVSSAATGDSIAIAGITGTRFSEAQQYVGFTIANSDPRDDGQLPQVRVQPAGLTEYAEAATAERYVNFTIANGDPNEEGEPTGVKIRPALTKASNERPNIGAGDDQDKPVETPVKLNIGPSDPAEQI